MVSTNIARTDDGTIQINFSIPKVDIDKAQEKALLDLAKDVTIPGFRKGNAPIEKVKEKIEPGRLLEKTLGQMLPDAYTKVITDNKIIPIIYPKFEIMKQGDTWEIQAEIAELPQVDLPDYKSLIKDALKNAKKEKPEDVVIKTLLEAIKVKIPAIIIEDEVNRRLSELLARTEKLGLKLEQYLASIGKDEKTLRADYEKQTADGISLELILNKIAETEKTEVSEKDVEEALKASGFHDEHVEHVNEQKALIRSVLKRRAVLENLNKLS